MPNLQIPDYQMLIDGEWRPAEAGGRIVVENPAHENPIATIPEGQAADAEAALAAAAAAQPAWAATPPIERAAYLHDLADAILRETEDLARCLTQEQGKPLHEARGEVGAAANFIRYAAEAARRLQGDIFPSDSPKEQLWIQRVPYGVVTAMIAWNFPLALIGRKCGPALVTGNTLVLLSHCDTPLTVLEFGKLVQEVGLPPGVINLVTGRGREIGEALVRNPRTDMVTLTGSVRAGREVYAAAADNITTIRLELGGKAPFIILEDADISQAAEAAVTTRFANCGQVCTCNERMYVHADIYEDFMDEFVGRVEALRVGDPLTDVHLGPKVNRPEVEKLERLVNGALAGGAKVVTGGRRLREGAFERGHWYEPTVMTHTQPDMAIMREEIFGPIVPVVRVRDFEEALALANDSDYGLSAYLYTSDMRRLMRAVDELHFGEIYVNRGIGELVQGFHHGYRRSGLGGEDGIYGIEGYLQKKTLYVNYA